MGEKPAANTHALTWLCWAISFEEWPLVILMQYGDTPWGARVFALAFPWVVIGTIVTIGERKFADQNKQGGM